MDIIKKNNKIAFRDDYSKEFVLDTICCDLNAMKANNNMKVLVTKEELKVIIDKFYDFYKKKKMELSFVDSILEHFNDMCMDVVDKDKVIDLDFILDGLALYELIDTKVEISPNDPKQLVKSVKEVLEQEVE